MRDSMIKDSRYDVQYNGVTGCSHGVFLYDYPSFSGGAKRYDETPVPGRVGDLVSEDTGMSNIAITCVFSVLSDLFTSSIWELKKWLSGTGEITFSDDADMFYRVLKVNYGDIERDIRRYGRFNVSFTCEPGGFLKNGQLEYEKEQVLHNPYSECCPIYRIAGNGTCALTVNGKTMKATVGQNLTIDTDRKMAYRVDGSMNNTAVNGDYEDLYLQPGENTITITSGFALKAIPNWRCL